jgi:hypothetical protein
VTEASHPEQLRTEARQATPRAPRSLFLALSVLHLLAEVAFVTQHSNPGRGVTRNRGGRVGAGAPCRLSAEPPCP